MRALNVQFTASNPRTTTSPQLQPTHDFVLSGQVGLPILSPARSAVGERRLPGVVLGKHEQLGVQRELEYVADVNA